MNVTEVDRQSSRRPVSASEWPSVLIFLLVAAMWTGALVLGQMRSDGGGFGTVALLGYGAQLAFLGGLLFIVPLIQWRGRLHRMAWLTLLLDVLLFCLLNILG